MNWPHLGHLQLFSRAVSSLTVVAEVEVSPQDEMASPQGMKVFAVERHWLPGHLVSFRTLCGVQSSLFVLAPNRVFVCDPLQGARRDSVCFSFALY